MDISVFQGLTTYGPLGLMVLALMFGFLVPKWYVSKLEKENEFLREDNRIKTELNKELSNTIANNNQLIGELRSLAHQRQSIEA